MSRVTRALRAASRPVALASWSTVIPVNTVIAASRPCAAVIVSGADAVVCRARPRDRKCPFARLTVMLLVDSTIGPGAKVEDGVGVGADAAALPAADAAGVLDGLSTNMY